VIDVIDAWLSLGAARLHDQAPALTALDQAIGDGDHGTNMDRGFTAIVTMIAAGPPEGETELLQAAARLRSSGRTLISTVGGAAGPLYGTALLRAANAVAAAPDGARTGTIMLDALGAAIGGIQGLGKSAPGEKTMLDALAPALSAGRVADAAGQGTEAIGRAVADAADAGAASTIPMLATKGRASYLGERSIGHQDPGATSSALLLRALADVISEAAS
jgi:dihydroxyacetone kinase-like protein